MYHINEETDKDKLRVCIDTYIYTCIYIYICKYAVNGCSSPSGDIHLSPPYTRTEGPHLNKLARQHPSATQGGAPGTQPADWRRSFLADLVPPETTLQYV